MPADPCSRKVGCVVLAVAMSGLIAPATATAQSGGAEPDHVNRSGAARQSDRASRAELARRIRERLRELEQIRQERERARQSHQAKLNTLDQQVDRLRQDRQSVEGEVTALTETIDKRRGKLDALKQKREAAGSLLTATASKARDVAERAHDRIVRGVAFDREARLERVATIQEPLGSQNKVEKAEGVTELLGLMGQELKRGRSIELTNTPVVLEPGERRKHAHVLRVGLVGGGFVSEDGSTIGMAAVGHSKRWQMDPDRFPRQPLRDAVGIFRQNEPPRLVSLPFPLARDGDASGDAANEQHPGSQPKRSH